MFNTKIVKFLHTDIITLGRLWVRIASHHIKLLSFSIARWFQSRFSVRTLSDDDEFDGHKFLTQAKQIDSSNLQNK